MADREHQIVELLKEISNLRHDLDIYQIIGVNSDGIEASGLINSFFGHVQFLAHHSIALRICKIYEPPNRFELNSIPGAIANLPEKLVSPEHEATVREFACRYGAQVAPEPRATLEATFGCFVEAKSEPLARLREFRHKVAAHSEADIQIESLPSRQAFDDLYEFAKDAYKTMRLAFHGVHPSLFPRTVGVGLYRLLEGAGAADPSLAFPRDYELI